MRRAACLAAALAGLLAAVPAPGLAQTTVIVIDPSDDDALIVRRPRYERPRYVAPSYRPPSYDAGTGIVPPLVDTYTPTQRYVPYPYPYRSPGVVIVDRPSPPPAGPGAGHWPPPPPVAGGLAPRR